MKITTQILQDIQKDPINFAKKISTSDLVELLRQFSDNYYNTGTSLISDDYYDILRDYLEEIDPTNKFLTDVGAPITANKEKVTLPYPMPSLSKKKPPKSPGDKDKSAVDSWKNTYPGPYLVSDKLDGVSGLLVKSSGKLQLYTRGNGTVGQNISHLIQHLLKGTDLGKIPDDVAIRGEIIMSKKNFKDIEDEFQNARNVVAGLVNSKNYSVKIANMTDFIGYAVLNPLKKFDDQLKFLRSINFPTVESKLLKEISDAILSDYLLDRKQNGIYEMDGLVVSDCSKIYPLTIDLPDYSFAFKMPSTEILDVKVLDLEWSISMHGVLKPRVRIEPVKLSGVDIQYLTAFNAKYVEDNNLGPGSIIRIIRSGDVIPHIISVISPAPKGPKMPDISYVWNDTHVDILPSDIHSTYGDDIKVKKIDHFFSVLGVQYFGQQIIKKFVDNGYNTIFKILEANRNDLSKIPGIGKKMIDKIYEGIDEGFKKITLDKLMAASLIFGLGLGSKKLRLILKEYPDILTVSWNKDTDEIIKRVIELKGFNTKTATKFAKQLSKFIDFYNQLSKIVDLTHIDSPTNDNSNKFKDMNVVFTGIRDKKLEELIEANGGKVSGSVSKNTTLVIYGEKAGDKKIKAEKLGIPLMTLDQFKANYKI